MDLKLLKRRVEMLDAVSTGLHPAAVVGQLAEKYGVSERTLWSDWERRAKWVPVLLKLEKFGDFAEMIEQKLNAVQKAAWSSWELLENLKEFVEQPFVRIKSVTPDLISRSFSTEGAYLYWINPVTQ